MVLRGVRSVRSERAEKARSEDGAEYSRDEGSERVRAVGAVVRREMSEGSIMTPWR